MIRISLTKIILCLSTVKETVNKWYTNGILNFCPGDQRHFGGPKTFWGAKDILGDQSRQSPKSWEDQSADGTKELGGQKVQETI